MVNLTSCSESRRWALVCSSCPIDGLLDLLILQVVTGSDSVRVITVSTGSGALQVEFCIGNSVRVVTDSTGLGTLQVDFCIGDPVRVVKDCTSSGSLQVEFCIDDSVQVVVDSTGFSAVLVEVSIGDSVRVISDSTTSGTILVEVCIGSDSVRVVALGGSISLPSFWFKLVSSGTSVLLQVVNGTDSRLL